jgi:hypothetical protein
MAKPHNPGGNAGKGRPKGAPNRATRELRTFAQEYTEEAVATLAEVMRDRAAPHAARVTASVALLDRGHGKPRQGLEHSGPDGKDLLPADPDPGKVALALLNVLRAAKAPVSAADGPQASEAPNSTPE